MFLHLDTRSTSTILDTAAQLITTIIIFRLFQTYQPKSLWYAEVALRNMLAICLSPGKVGLETTSVEATFEEECISLGSLKRRDID